MEERREKREEEENKWIFPCFSFPFPEVDAGVYRGGHLVPCVCTVCLVCLVCHQRKKVMFTSPDTTALSKA